MSEAKWVTINVSSMPETLQKKYNDYKEAYRLASDIRKTFEEAAVSHGKATKAIDGISTTYAFGYKFGNLSRAIVAPRSGSTSRGGSW